MCHVKPTVNNKVASKFLRIFSSPSSTYIFAKKEHVFLQFFIRLGLSLFLSSGLKFRNCRSHTHSLIHFTLCIRWNNRLPKANKIDSRYELCVSDCMQNIVKIESFVVCLPVMRAFRFMPLFQVFRQMSHDAHIQFQKLRNIWVNFSSEMVLRKECFEEDHKRISPISMEWNIGAICQKCATQASDKKDYKVQAVAQNHIRIWKILFPKPLCLGWLNGKEINHEIDLNINWSLLLNAVATSVFNSMGFDFIFFSIDSNSFCWHVVPIVVICIVTENFLRVG